MTSTGMLVILKGVLLNDTFILSETPLKINWRKRNEAIEITGD